MTSYNITVREITCTFCTLCTERSRRQWDATLRAWELHTHWMDLDTTLTQYWALTVAVCLEAERKKTKQKHKWQNVLRTDAELRVSSPAPGGQFCYAGLIIDTWKCEAVYIYICNHSVYTGTRSGRDNALLCLTEPRLDKELSIRHVETLGQEPSSPPPHTTSPAETLYSSDESPLSTSLLVSFHGKCFMTF